MVYNRQGLGQPARGLPVAGQAQNPINQTTTVVTTTVTQTTYGYPATPSRPVTGRGTPVPVTTPNSTFMGRLGREIRGQGQPNPRGYIATGPVITPNGRQLPGTRRG